jgi:hypothetical protein
MNLDVNHNMQITEIAVTVVVAIIPFEVFPEKSVWSIPARQADDHMIAVPGSGGFSLFTHPQALRDFDGCVAET